MTFPFKGFTDNPDHDQYTNPPMLTDSSGETVFDIVDGNLEPRWKEHPERLNKWKGSKRIAAIPDEGINVIGERPSGIVDYLIDGTRVSWGHGKRGQGYMCHRHVTDKCPCIKRIDRFRGENFV